MLVGYMTFFCNSIRLLATSFFVYAGNLVIGSLLIVLFYNYCLVVHPN